MIRAVVWMLAIGWMAFIAFRAMESWPAIPLDIGRDPQVVALHDKVVQDHVVRHALIGAGPAIVLISIMAIIRRRKRSGY